MGTAGPRGQVVEALDTPPDHAHDEATITMPWLQDDLGFVRPKLKAGRAHRERL